MHYQCFLTRTVTADDQVKAYIKKIMSQLKDWMYGGKISKLVIVITSKETGEHVERWQFDVSVPMAIWRRWLRCDRSKYLARIQNPNPRKNRVTKRILHQRRYIKIPAKYKLNPHP